MFKFARMHSYCITNIPLLRKPICDIVFCVMAFLYVEFSVL